MAEEERDEAVESEHPEPHPQDQPADVFDTRQESEAWVVRGLLANAGLDAEVINREASPDVLPGVGGFVVRVPEEEAAEARRIIAENRSRPGDDSEASASGESAA